MDPSPARSPIRIAVVGLGKVARDRHVPALTADSRFELVATASPDGASYGDVAPFDTLEALLASGPPLDAVALCTPPQVRHALAARAIDAGLHVLLEKPPGATVGEIDTLVAAARRAGTTLFAAWHSRFAGGVDPAQAWLRGRRVEHVSIVWREDVRSWHPGQAWIWEPGIGVFDPGINALSIVTAVLPDPVVLESAVLVVPTNRAAPIAARLGARTTAGAAVTVDLDWRQTGTETWDIAVHTDHGELRLGRGGAVLATPDRDVARFEDREYPDLYGRFHDLIRRGQSDVDLTPFRLVADAFLLGRREPTDAFHD